MKAFFKAFFELINSNPCDTICEANKELARIQVERERLEREMLADLVACRVADKLQGLR